MLKATKNAMAISGVLHSVRNHPQQFRDRQHRYFEAETALFTQENAKYASDVYDADVQGLDFEDRYRWTKEKIRVADVVRPTAALGRNFDDYKMVQFVRRKVDYLRRGSFLKFAGSVWIVLNPQNVSGRGNSVIRRCNATWNHYDYYGNLLKEPVVVDSEIVKANASDPQEFIGISKGYLNVICQYNPWTEQVDTNTRLMFGRDVYSVTGPCSFLEEFTGDESSVCLVEFTARLDELNDNLDNVADRVAGGKQFKWNISLQGQSSLSVGQSVRFSARSQRNGEEVPGDKVDYTWESENQNVLQVDETGLVTAIGEGECVLTCKLLQNEYISSFVTIHVESGESRLVFLEEPPERLKAYQFATFSASLLENGQESETPVSFVFLGERGSYTAEQDGNRMTIKCWKRSDTPLVVRAVCGEFEIKREIKLIGI